jgi:hypothetical protein
VKYTDLSCIRCGKKFSTDSPPDWGEEGPPNDGLLFLSYGNYGSTVFDAQDSNEYLIVVLCDECAVFQAGAQNVMHVRKSRHVPPPKPRYRGPWIPEGAAATEDGLSEMREP